MKNKPNDISYCGCDIDKIRSMSPSISIDNLKLFYYYVTERYNIYKKRELGIPAPWTDDPILKEYKFTNVRREHDRTSKWLIENISNNPMLPYEDRFWRTILFRTYNRIETAELIGLDDPEFWYNINDNVSNISAIPGDVYTRAYKTVSTKYVHKSEYPEINWRAHPILFIHDMIIKYDAKIPDICKNAETVIEWLKSFEGFGDFISYQIFVDLTYIDEFPISENEFVLCGPGCRAGMDFVIENVKRLRVNYSEALFWLRDNIEKLFLRIDENYSSDKLFENLPDYDRKWNIMALENCFCEFSKYIYLKKGTHKNPRRYVSFELDRRF